MISSRELGVKMWTAQLYLVCHNILVCNWSFKNITIKRNVIHVTWESIPLALFLIFKDTATRNAKMFLSKIPIMLQKIVTFPLSFSFVPKN
jgi:hypothetical protein